MSLVTTIAIYYLLASSPRTRGTVLLKTKNSLLVLYYAKTLERHNSRTPKLSTLDLRDQFHLSLFNCFEYQFECRLKRVFVSVPRQYPTIVCRTPRVNKRHNEVLHAIVGHCLSNSIRILWLLITLTLHGYYRRFFVSG